ncbi:MAG: hypothetical protein JSV25_02745 [Spirochaetota bacterium]|nr:MAG: hypothetical protein JSV25_02745 [Spirochaetota bacterium]
MFKKLVKKVFEPISMGIIVVGIIALCQPWFLQLHRRGFIIIIVGLASFIIFSHFKQPVEEEKEEEAVEGI